MKACVVFDTRYGNTEKIARSLEAGLKTARVETSCVNEKDASQDLLGNFDLICVGGPTHHRTASEPMQTFLRSLKGADLSDKLTFAFDTRRDSPLAGSAAKFIEGRLRGLGSKVVIQRVSAIILDPPPEGGRQPSENKDDWKERRHRTARLRDGEEERFREIGSMMGVALSPRPTPDRV